MRQFVILSILFLSFFGQSQTKLIAHKSHSGNNETFAIAIENELFENDSNFGLSPMRIENHEKLDSVIFISENKILTISSEFTRRVNRVDEKICSRDELIKIKKDTVFIKPKSLKKGLTINEVKANLDSLKIYNNDLSQTVYKGFDEKSKRKHSKKKSIFPVISNFPNIPNSFFLIGTLAFLSVLIYLFASSFIPNFRDRKLTLSN